MYHFTTHEAMENDIRRVEYLEYGTHNGHLYGTYYSVLCTPCLTCIVYFTVHPIACVLPVSYVFGVPSFLRLLGLCRFPQM